jgi:large subunit ribosomal protein L17
MKHQISGSKLGRSAPQRNSLRLNLLKALFEHERIKTTEAKAKFIRSDAEKLITLAKRGNKAKAGEGTQARANYVSAQRLAKAKLNDPAIVHKLFETIGPRFEKRPGGYTRILKLGARLGDAAEVVLLELVEE